MKIQLIHHHKLSVLSALQPEYYNFLSVADTRNLVANICQYDKKLPKLN